MHPMADRVAAFVCGASRGMWDGTRRGKLPRTANHGARGVADRYAFIFKIVDCVAVRYTIL